MKVSSFYPTKIAMEVDEITTEAGRTFWTLELIWREHNENSPKSNLTMYFEDRSELNKTLETIYIFAMGVKALAEAGETMELSV
jgi:hypothetical protein